MAYAKQTWVDGEVPHAEKFNHLEDGVENALSKDEAAKVATSGSYNDLNNKPTIPPAYTLPYATSSVLGGVKPLWKIAEATQPVYVDSAGRLYTVPSSGGGDSGSGVTNADLMLAINQALNQKERELRFEKDENGDVVLKGLSYQDADITRLSESITDLNGDLNRLQAVVIALKEYIENGGGTIPDWDIIPNRILLWEDNFEGETLNEDVWGYEFGYVRNNEKQYYTNLSKNIYVSDGILHIVALKDNPADNFEWSSASIDTQIANNMTEGTQAGIQRSTGFSYGYGLIEIKARCNTPKNGVWPAFWSRGASQQGEGWPMCGEIDIAELFFDSNSNAHRFNPGIFWYDWHELSQKSQHATITGLDYSNASEVIYKHVDTNWHYFGMERNEHSMDFYFDRVKFCSVNLDAIESKDIQMAMRQPMSLKFNLAMGSSGGEIDPSINRADFEIDYVRYYAPVGVSESNVTDSGTWDFPAYTPTEIEPNKVVRIIPDRNMETGRNQYLYWESSDASKATAAGGLINTKVGASGNVNISMSDTFGNKKTKTITIKTGADCKSTEVREIGINSHIFPYGESIDVNVRLVPNWITNHDVSASIVPSVDGVTVSVSKSSHVIAKYSTPISIITVTNNNTSASEVNANLVVTANDSGATLSIPITISAGKEAFDTSGMDACYIYQNIKNDKGTGILMDSAGNHDPINNIYYGPVSNNGVCYINGKGIQAQTQNASFANSGDGFFFGEFDPLKDYTFLVNIKASKTEMRQGYSPAQAVLSICHPSIGNNPTSNTIDGRHGYSYGYSWSGNTGDSYLKCISSDNGNNICSGFTMGDFQYKWANSTTRPYEIEIDNTEVFHDSGSLITFAFVYHAHDKSYESYCIAKGKLLGYIISGIDYASTEANFNSGKYNMSTNYKLNETILSESATDPFYIRYGNANQKVSDMLRAIVVYESAKDLSEIREVDSRINTYLGE